MTAPATERGSGTLLVAAGILISGLVAAVVVVVAAAGVAGHRVRAAADLVALSAATEHSVGGQGCRAAARIAAANEVSLRECVLRGDLIDFAVTVVVAGRAPLDGLPVLTATAHAGRVVPPGQPAPTARR